VQPGERRRQRGAARPVHRRPAVSLPRRAGAPHAGRRVWAPPALDDPTARQPNVQARSVCARAAVESKVRMRRPRRGAAACGHGCGDLEEAILSLGSCLMDPATFLAEQWLRRPVHDRGGPRRFTELLDAAEVEEFVAWRGLRLPAFRMVRQGTSSIHLTLGVHVVTWLDVLGAALQRAPGCVELRSAIPCGAAAESRVACATLVAPRRADRQRTAQRGLTGVPWGRSVKTASASSGKSECPRYWQRAHSR
jgi:hypothetical protein